MIRRLQPDPPSAPLDAAGLDRAYAWPAGLWVRANFAASVDGAVEVDGRSGGLGGPDDRTIFAQLRSGADAVLVGSGTVRAENYGVVRLDEAALARRRTRGQAPAVPVAVVSNRADLNPASRLFREAASGGQARPLVLTCAAADAASRSALGDVAEVVICGDGSVDDRLVIEALVARGHRAVLCEGGPTTLGRLARAGLVDELCLTVAPLLAGPGHVGLLGRDLLENPIPMERTHLLCGDDGTVFARYRLAAAIPPTTS